MTAFVAPGAGRCGYHATDRERVRVLSARRAVAETRELRALDGDESRCAEQPDARCDGRSKPPPRFDVDRFSGSDLDE